MAAAAPTMTTTRDDDTRGNQVHGLATPVWEKVMTALWDADDTADGTIALTVNGNLRKIIVEVPNTTNAITTQVALTDNQGNTIFDSGEKDENATYTYDVDELLSGTTTVTIGVSGAVGATTSTVRVTLKGV